jgi:hypothetical protein
MSKELPVGLQRKKLRQAIKEKRKEVLPKLKASIKEAKKQKARRIKECKQECRILHRKFVSDAKRARQKLAAHITRARDKAKEFCKSCKVTVEAENIAKIQKALEAIKAESEQIKELAKKASSIKSERGRKGGLAAAEKKAESDDFVRQNLGDDKELIDLFNTVKSKIKPSPQRSRTEAFFEFVESHPEALEELRAKKEKKWQEEAEKLFRERSECSISESDCVDKLTKILKEWKSAEKFLEEAPF